MRVKVIVIGGGYAGLATVIELRHSLPEAKIHVIDPRENHLKITHLHQTLRYPLSDYQIPFAVLAKRFAFVHHRTALHFTANDLSVWQWNKAIPLPDGEMTFDYLVIATGAKPHQWIYGANRNGCVYGLDHFTRQEGQAVLNPFLTNTENGECVVSIVGGGATSLQFLFEIYTLLRDSGIRHRLRLIYRGDQILSKLPKQFHTYVNKCLRKAGVECLPHTEYQFQNEGQIYLKDLKTRQSYGLFSGLTLLFPGVVPNPWQLCANRYGQVIIDRVSLSNVFAAGDCSHFTSSGLNSLTAQAAVRKGKQVACNIKRLQQNRLPYIYSYRELGYFISLGPRDGIGWMILKNNVISGFPAFAVKEMVEAQYDLLTEGLDLYL
jgi:NADH dehydrogenase